MGLVDRLTEISLVHNIDGVHTESSVLGYVADEPFCVLSSLLTKYFICGYDKELYPMMMVSYKFALYIRDAGRRYTPNNTSKFQYHDVENLIIDSDTMYLAKVSTYGKEYGNEYLNMLNQMRGNIIPIQKAIDCQVIVDKGKFEPIEMESRPELLKKRLVELSDIHIEDDPLVFKLYCSVLNHLVFALTINEK